MPDPSAARTALRAVIAEQIACGDPPETKATLKRLLASGVAEDEAWRLLMHALLEELNEMMRAGRPFNRAHFGERLARLPDIKRGDGSA